MTTTTTLDLNCDMGEGFGAYSMGNDIEILDHVTSANIACGFHAGDPPTMRRIVGAALAKGVAVGAHPGLPDLQGFGRRAMQVAPAEAYAMVVYQVGALAGFAQAAGGRLNHVKPHGALYNMAAKDRKLSDAIAQAVFDFDPALILFGLAGSEMINAAEALGLRSASEVFADRSYQDDGTLSPRGQAGALIEDADQSLAQVRQMLAGSVRAASGRDVAVRADTLCLHGDQPGALVFARHIRSALVADGVALQAPSRH
ncbi:MAG: 5-oxoprolinase subunit PxpA [Burkholderiaceae bacterium]